MAHFVPDFVKLLTPWPKRGPTPIVKINFSSQPPANHLTGAKTSF